MKEGKVVRRVESVAVVPACGGGGRQLSESGAAGGVQ